MYIDWKNKIYNFILIYNTENEHTHINSIHICSKKDHYPQKCLCKCKESRTYSLCLLNSKCKDLK